MGHQNPENLWDNIEPAEPPAYLFRAITDRIRNEKQLTVFRKKLTWSLAGFSGSLAALMFASSLLGGSLAASGIFKITSLAFSDPGVVFDHFGNFVLFAAESFPALDAFLFLAALFVALAALREVALQFTSVSSSLKLIK